MDPCGIRLSGLSKRLYWYPRDELMCGESVLRCSAHSALSKLARVGQKSTAESTAESTVTRSLCRATCFAYCKAL